MKNNKIVTILVLMMAFLSASSLGYASDNKSVSNNSTVVTKNQFGLNQFSSLNVVLGQPQEVFSRNLTPQELSININKITEIVNHNLSKNKVNTDLAIEVKFDSNKQEINLLYKNKINKELIPIFNDMKEELKKLPKITTTEPLSFMILFSQ